MLIIQNTMILYSRLNERNKMKKLFLVGILMILPISCITNKAQAQNFDFGVTTYGQVDNELIVNSTGDQYALSTYGALGTNDFIGELAEKNLLQYEGYTVAYDYNPQNTNGQYSNYNVSLPTNVPLTAIQFAGFEGNPRAVQTVYVPTSEYNALNPQMQASSISSITANQLIDEGNINVLQTTVGNQGILINGVQNQVTTIASNQVADEANIANNTSNIASNTSSINQLNKTTAHEERQIRREQKEINKVRQVANTAYNNTVIDQQEITSTNNTVASQGQAIQSQQNQINGLNNRVHSLERPQGIIGGQLRVFDSRKWQINAFVDYDTTRTTVSEVGIRVTYKLGKSYEETRIDELNKKLDKLLGQKEQSESASHIKQYNVNNGVGIKEEVNF